MTGTSVCAKRPVLPWRPHTLFNSVVFPESCRPTSPETDLLINKHSTVQARFVPIWTPMKHSLTRMQRILWTASMHAILRSKLSLLSSVLFSIPLPRKFSIPCSLDIVFKVGVKWSILLVKHEKQGFFRAVDAVVVSQVRDCLHPRRVYLSEEIFYCWKIPIDLFHLRAVHIEELCCDPSENLEGLVAFTNMMENTQR